MFRLKRWAEKVGRDNNVLAIVLFGSFAKKEETPASDVDILILLKDSRERFDNRIPHFIPTGIGVSVDVFPYTLREFHSGLRENWGIAQEVMKSGLLLYGIGVNDTEEKVSFHSWFCALEKSLGELGTREVTKG